tara:strand:- start:202 stop:474 length:273 start_codon:yes stop_codon:yes gene_type:complete
MSLYKDLLSYKRKSLYNVAKFRKDSRLNVANDYEKTGLLQNMLSKHIQRNTTLSEFIDFLNDYLLNILKGNRFLRGYKNYTVKKDDKYIR